MEVKLRAGKYRLPASLTYKDGRIFVQFKFSRALIAEIKAMSGAKWHGFEDPPRKVWSITDNAHNAFQLDYLQGKDPYAPFDKEIIKQQYVRPLYEHQKDAADFLLSRHYCVLAGEMGVGKTLCVIETMERSGCKDIWYVAPKSGIRAVEREFDVWNFDLDIKMMTYEKMTNVIKNWKAGDTAPDFVVFDESQKIKTPTTQRSQAAMMLANGVRQDWGDSGFVILMSGSPAPKAPSDWWHQCFSKDTWTLTLDGPKQIRELISQPIGIRVQGQNYQTNGFFKTGTRKLYKLKTKEGYSVEATSDHKFRKSNGEWCELKDLKLGDSLQLANYSDFNWDGCGTFGDGYILGLLFGDGNIYKKGNNYYGRLQFFEEDYHLIEILKDYFPSDFNITGNNPWQIHDNYITELVREFGFDNKKKITPFFESSISSDCMRGFLRGFFDADGHAEKSRLRITLSQTDRNRIYTVQRMLTYFGIQSNICVKKKSSSCIEGRKINSAEINYILFVTNIDAIHFEERIGFHHQKKIKTLHKRIENRHNWLRRFVTVKDITYSKTDDVFDINVPKVHAFAANGFLAHNCEVGCPGFLKEGDIHKFKRSLAVVIQRETFQGGGVYPHLQTWLDDECKCAVCGELEHDDVHDKDMCADNYHAFIESKNEVARLYRRMDGLVLVQLKKDHLDLPDKIYRRIVLKPDQETLQIAKSLVQTSPTVIGGLTLVRELSDGFQYQEVKDGTMTCKVCGGLGRMINPIEPEEKCDCDGCGGSGQCTKYKRTIEDVGSPKDAALLDLLDAHDDCGRIVVYASFTGSVDRIVQICHDHGWATIRVDGRGWNCSIDECDPLSLFQDQLIEHPKVAFIAHPESGGIGLTLTASPTIVYYSNDFNAASRIQSEDRIHRPGLDLNRGATIIDLIHLPTDDLVLKNLQQKRRLQSLTLGEVERCFEV